MTESIEPRHCGARTCGKPLIRFAYENAYAFKIRKTCGPGTECPNIMRVDAKRAKLKLAAEGSAAAEDGPLCVHELLMPWHRQVQRNQ